MSFRALGPLLCGGLLMLATATGAVAQSRHGNTQQPTEPGGFYYVPGTDTVRPLYGAGFLNFKTKGSCTENGGNWVNGACKKK